MNLCNKSCIYVGGFGGIGFAFCKRLLAKKIKALMIFDLELNKKMFEDLKACGPTTCIKFKEFDLRDPKKKIQQKVQEAACEMGQLDFLVNGSGIVKDSDVDATIDTNLTGLIHTTQAAYPIMGKNAFGKGGLIMQVSSILGVVVAPHISVYTGTKHAVIGFHRGISDKFYYDLTGIMNIAVCPGFTTGTLIFDNFESDEGLLKQVTFKFGLDLVKQLKTNLETQTADQCATHMLNIAETGENAGIYIIDLNKTKKITIPEYLPI